MSGRRLLAQAIVAKGPNILQELHEDGWIEIFRGDFITRWARFTNIDTPTEEAVAEANNLKPLNAEKYYNEHENDNISTLMVRIRDTQTVGFRLVFSCEIWLEHIRKKGPSGKFLRMVCYNSPSPQWLHSLSTDVLMRSGGWERKWRIDLQWSLMD